MVRSRERWSNQENLQSVPRRKARWRVGRAAAGLAREEGAAAYLRDPVSDDALGEVRP